MMKRSQGTYRTAIAAAALLAASPVRVARAADPAPVDATDPRQADVTVSTAPGGATVLEFRPRYMAPVILKIGGSDYVRYDFEGGLTPRDAAPGAPRLPVRSVPVLLTSPADLVEVISAEYSDSAGALIVPWSGMTESAGAVPVHTTRPDPAAYAAAGYVPAEVAALEAIGDVRGSILGNLVIAPIRYDPSRRNLRVYSKIVVRIVPAGGESRARAGDRLVSGIAVNDPTGARGPLGGDARDPGAGREFKTAGLTSSVLSQGPWLKLSVTEEGMYRLTGQMLAGAGVPTSADPRTIRIFGNGGAELPVDPLAPVAADLTELPRLVADGGTAGVLDPGDEIVFYGQGTRGWRYDPAARRISHTINRYWATNYYWVTYGGVPGIDMPPAPSPVPAQAVSIVEGRLFREDDRQNILSSGMNWLGQSFNSGDRLTYAHPLPGLVPGGTLRYRLRLGSRASSSSTFAISEHGAQLGTFVGIPGTDVGDYFDEQVLFAVADRAASAAWTDGQSVLNIAYGSTNTAGTGFLDWYEISYDRRTVAHADRFDFHLPDTNLALAYTVTGFTGTAVRVFEVSRHDSVRLVLSDNHSDSCSFRAAGIPGSRRQILAAGPGGYLAPQSIVPAANQDLRGASDPADLYILAHPSLLAAANRLGQYREQPGEASIATRVVNIEEVYNEFGGGIPSPVAIRNYLEYVYQTQIPPPRYALLFGDGDYDYRRIVASGPNLIPPWETENSYLPISTLTSDDYFAIFGSSGRIQIALGRLTVQSVAEASAMVDKIIAYETGAVNDPWKTLVTFVADDGPQDEGVTDGILHVAHAEDVQGRLPDLFDKRKIYLSEYETQFSASGRRKPAVNTAIRDAINRGTLVLNFSGHGNPRLWTHEAVFVREDDIPLLSNRGKYFILVAATCNYANFDAVTDQSGGELLASLPEAGAIAGLSATRVVFASDNRELNRTFFTYLFETDSTGGMATGRIGDAMFRTKQVHTGANDRKYFLLGDPALVPAFPRRYVSVDSVNHRPLDQVVDLYALGLSSVSASVAPESAAAPYSGSAQVIVYDADRPVTIANDPPGVLTYQAPGDILFRGEATVTAGRMGANFIVPKDISYGAGNGRITVYTWNAQEDGAGFTRNIRIAGTDSTAPADGTGPAMSIFIDSRGFRPGDAVSTSPTLIVDLADSSGINTSRAGIGHRLEAWLDDQPASADLSDYYRSNPDTYRRGSVTYPLGALTPGTHRIKVRAWDTYNNASMGETVFGVGGSGGLQISAVYNYPNPFVRSTWFTFEHNQTSPVDVEVKIYTVAGRMIHSLAGYGVGERFVRIPWDGRDREGDDVANGVYLYKIVARTTDGRYSGEALGKLSVAR